SMRDVVGLMIRRYDSTPGDKKHDKELRIYYRDISDHLVRVTEMVETYRDLLSGSLDIYLSAVANRTNEIMKVLTIWGTIALPLVVTTGFYGMNVKLPAQDHPYAVYFLIGLMGATTLGSLYYFHKKKWM